MLQDKQSLRSMLRARRRQLSATNQQTFSTAVSEQLLATVDFQRANRIAVYIAHDAEVDLSVFIQIAWQSQKSIYLPVVQGKQLIFIAYDMQTTLHKNAYGILEPSLQTASCLPEKLDLVLAPLVGFDSHGHRLGMGAGYYDRTFSFLKTADCHTVRYIGVGYACQEVQHIPVNEFDVLLDGVCTEHGM